MNSLDNSWQVIKLFNEGKLRNAPSTTGLTIVQKKEPKLHLVTVVGDFHKDLTLIQMLNHYRNMVDDAIIIHYVTGKKSRVEVAQESIDFSKYLIENKIDFATVHTVTGDKYDWDKVTEYYNMTTLMSPSPDDWWIIADCDELQIWPEEPKKVIERANKLHCTFITGGFVDRIGEGGQLSEIKGPSDDLDKLFPLVGFFRYPMSKACPNKVVAVKSGQQVCSGQHYAVFSNGTNSWGSSDPRGFYKAAVIVFHFKWDKTVLDRLKETGESGCSYSEEYSRMREAILRAGGRIPVEDPKYRVERYMPELGYYSYSKWPEVFKEIQMI